MEEEITYTDENAKALINKIDALLDDYLNALPDDSNLHIIGNALLFDTFKVNKGKYLAIGLVVPHQK